MMVLLPLKDEKGIVKSSTRMQKGIKKEGVDRPLPTGFGSEEMHIVDEAAPLMLDNLCVTSQTQLSRPKTHMWQSDSQLIEVEKLVNSNDVPPKKSMTEDQLVSSFHSASFSYNLNEGSSFSKTSEASTISDDKRAEKKKEKKKRAKQKKKDEKRQQSSSSVVAQQQLEEGIVSTTTTISNPINFSSSPSMSMSNTEDEHRQVPISPYSPLGILMGDTIPAPVSRTAQWIAPELDVVLEESKVNSRAESPIADHPQSNNDTELMAGDDIYRNTIYLETQLSPFIPTLSYDDSISGEEASTYDVMERYPVGGRRGGLSEPSTPLHTPVDISYPAGGISRSASLNIRDGVHGVESEMDERSNWRWQGRDSNDGFTSSEMEWHVECLRLQKRLQEGDAQMKAKNIPKTTVSQYHYAQDGRKLAGKKSRKKVDYADSGSALEDKFVAPSPGDIEMSLRPSFYPLDRGFGEETREDRIARESTKVPMGHSTEWSKVKMEQDDRYHRRFELGNGGHQSRFATEPRSNSDTRQWWAHKNHADTGILPTSESYASQTSVCRNTLGLFTTGQYTMSDPEAMLNTAHRVNGSPEASHSSHALPPNLQMLRERLAAIKSLEVQRSLKQTDQETTAESCKGWKKRNKVLGGKSAKWAATKRKGLPKKPWNLIAMTTVHASKEDADERDK